MLQFRTTDIPNDGGDPKEAVVSMFVGIGLLEGDARRLVEDELFFEPSVSISLSQLFYGKRIGKSWQMPTAVEQRTATKLLNYMQTGEGEPLTDEEKAVLTVATTNKVLVKDDGFLQRAAGYCNSEEVLHKLLKLVSSPTPS
jgi:hypothetical protein